MNIPTMLGVLSLACGLANGLVGRAAAESGGQAKVISKGPAAVIKGLTNTGSVGFPEARGGGVDRAEDRTQAPYFYVAGGNPDTERLPLKETRAEV
ncbi:MAG TPA: hypothetical protein VF518_12930, partial [Polyangia bacterium]